MSVIADTGFPAEDKGKDACKYAGRGPAFDEQKLFGLAVAAR